MARIMLVDDEPNILSALRRTIGASVSDGINRFDVSVETFHQPATALMQAEGVKFDLVLSDYRMPGMDGVAFLKAFRNIQPDAARLILSGYADLDALIGAINEAQIFRFIHKPWQDYEVTTTIAQALALRDLHMENQRLADLVRLQQGKLSRQELELRRLEAETPGITRVNWGADGSVLLDEEM